MYCTGCQSTMKVGSTHNIETVLGTTFRYRKCPSCGMVIQTEEKVTRVLKESSLEEGQEENEQKRTKSEQKRG